MTFSRITGIATAAFAMLAGDGAGAGDKPCGKPVCLPVLSQHGRVAEAEPIVPPIVKPKASGPPPRSARAPSAVELPYPQEARTGEPPPYQLGDYVFTSSLYLEIGALSDCRFEVARARGVPEALLPDETAHLRVTISPKGKVVRSTVSTTGAIGIDFLDCLKTHVQSWQLPGPEGKRSTLVDVDVKMHAEGRSEIVPSNPEPVS